MAGALIVTAELGSADFAWLDALRQAHFPPHRNRLPAHLTIFHALPPSAEAEVKRRLRDAVRGPPPKAMLAGLINLGGGVAFRIVSDGLDSIRAELAAGLDGLLGPQDRGGWRPHVTIQNKVRAAEARALMERLDDGFEPRPLAISGLALHHYLDGPWEPIAAYRFRS